MFSERPIRHILFDVADTLLYKPALWPTIASTLAAAGVSAEIGAIARAHRATREILTAPDRTGREFYLDFNVRFLEVLGVLPTAELAEQIYLDCRQLPWTPFADTAALAKLGVPVGVVSNWDNSLRGRLARHFDCAFDPIVISAEVGFAKPDRRMFEHAAEATGKLADEILVVGDSIHLDIVPALAAGLRAALIDRNGLCPGFNGLRLESLDELAGLCAAAAVDR